MPVIPLRAQFLNINFSLPFKDPVLIFSVVLFIILLAPIILRKFRIPSIIGLIIAGVIIGPKGFNILAFDSSIKLFGMVGLLYLMFLAGLDLEMNEFRKSRNKSLFFGILTFIIPFSIGVPVCLYLFHFNLMTSALISSMFATHTLVAYPIASKLGITKNEIIAIAVGGTIISDTLVLLLLAVITGAKEGALNQVFWLKLGVSILLFAIIVFATFPPIGRWFFKNIKEDNTAQYVFVLGMVFLAGLLAELAGMEAIIGAFMAGLALNRLIPPTSPLMNRIEFVGNTLFIPFFLLSVGMRVDLQVFFKGPEVLILSGVLLVIAFAGKWVASWITQKRYGYSVSQRNVLFGLTSARAAATLAVILVGYQVGIIDVKVLNGTIILILITCLVSSFITENSGRKLAVQESETLPQIEEEKERIMVPISNPDTIVSLMDFAGMLRDSRQNQPVFALEVVYDDHEAPQKVTESRKMLKEAIKHMAATDTEVKVRTRVDLSVVSGITRAFKEIVGTDLIIGWSRRISTTDRLFGTKLGSLLGSIWKNIYVCHFITPINTANRMVIMMPEYLEYEMGFGHLARKIHFLAMEAGVNVILYSTKETYKVLQQELDKLKSSMKIQHRLFKHPEDFYLIAQQIAKNDLFLVVSARKGTISYEPFLDNIPSRLNKYLDKTNYVLIYPEQHAMAMRDVGMQPKDVNLAPIQEQLENLTRISRAVKRMFHSREKEREPDEDDPQDDEEAGNKAV